YVAWLRLVDVEPVITGIAQVLFGLCRPALPPQPGWSEHVGIREVIRPDAADPHALPEDLDIDTGQCRARRFIGLLELHAPGQQPLAVGREPGLAPAGRQGRKAWTVGSVHCATLCLADCRVAVRGTFVCSRFSQFRRLHQLPEIRLERERVES